MTDRPQSHVAKDECEWAIGVTANVVHRAFSCLLMLRPDANCRFSRQNPSRVALFRARNTLPARTNFQNALQQSGSSAREK
jgi:hypothetical protein